MVGRGSAMGSMAGPRVLAGTPNSSSSPVTVSPVLNFFPDCVCFGSRDGTDVYWRLYDVRKLALKTSKYKLQFSTLVDGSSWIFLITKPQSAKIQTASSCNLGNLAVFLAGACHVMVW